MTKQEKSSEELELERCLTALYVAVSEDVAKDVQSIVMRVVNQQAEEIEKLKELERVVESCFAIKELNRPLTDRLVELVDSYKKELASRHQRNTQLQSRFDELVKSLEAEKASKQFYAVRCELLQAIQDEMRDPERKAVCDILANGSTTAIVTKAKGQANGKV